MMSKRTRISKMWIVGAIILALNAFSTVKFNQAPSVKKLKADSTSSWWWSSSLSSLAAWSGRRQSNTTLVIVLGSLRCGEDAWRSLYGNVLDYNNADLALMIGDTSPQHQNSTMFDRAKYLWKFDEYDDWADAIDLVNGPEWRTTLLPHVGNEGLLGGVKGKRSTGGLLMMARWFLMQHMEEDRILDKYDKFVITRSDHYYQCPHDLAPLDTEQFIWIPRGESYGGYTDRHLVIGRNHIMAAIDLITPLVTNPQSFTRSALTMEDNIEQFQTRIWHRKGILPMVRSFKRMMFVCAASDDTTRWKQKSHHKVPGTIEDSIFVKYYFEYQKAVHFCRNQTTPNLLKLAEHKPRLKIAQSVLGAGKKKGISVAAQIGSPDVGDVDVDVNVETDADVAGSSDSFKATSFAVAATMNVDADESDVHSLEGDQSNEDSED